MGLYDPRFEHDACGLAGLARLDGRADHELVERALLALGNLDHRGATGADPDTGDGAGILTQLPDALPAPRLPRGARHRAAAARRLRRRHGVPAPRPAACACAARSCACGSAREEGHRAAGLARRAGAARTRSARSRATAAAGHPPAARRAPRAATAEAFERKLYVIRRRVEQAAAARRRRRRRRSRSSSLSLAHAGLQGPAARAASSTRFYPDLREPDFASRAGARPLALLDEHARHLGSRAPVQLPGAQRRDQHRARQRQLAARARAAAALASCSAATCRSSSRSPTSAGRTPPTLDAMLELLVLRRPLAAARAGDADPAGLERPDARPAATRCARSTSTTRRLVEPWDGPAAVIATDGRAGRSRRSTATACARPRYAAHPRRAGRARLRGRRARPRPGRRSSSPAASARAGCWSSTPSAGPRRAATPRSSASWPRRRPYRALARRAQAVPRRPAAREPVAPLAARRAAPAAARRSATPTEELRAADRRRWRATAPSRSARWATTRRWRRSPSAPQLLVRLLQAAVRPGHEPADRPAARGARDEPAHVRRRDRQPARRAARATAAGWRCRTPVLQNGELEKLAPRCGRERLPLADAADAVRPGARGRRRRSSARSTGCAARPRRRSWDGADDPDPVRPRRRRRASRRSRRCWRRPPCTRTSCARARARCAAWWSSRASRARRCTSRCCSATAPRPSTRTSRWRRCAAARGRRAGRADARRGARALRRGVGKGLLKVCSKMGISTVQSYRGAQIFEAVGLGPRLVDRYFTGTVSRVGGIELPDIADDGRRAATRPRRVARRRRGARPRRRVPAAPARRAPRLEPATRSCGCSARCATTATRRFRGLRRGASTRPPRAARRCAACSSSRRPAQPLPLEEVEPSTEIVQAVRHRRDEPRLDLARRRTRRWPSP